MFGTMREARLRGQAADRYPFLPVRMWTEAARMVELVQKHPQRIGEQVRARRRTLGEQDFRFRGGFRHEPGVHTRMTDPEVPKSGPSRPRTRPLLPRSLSRSGSPVPAAPAR